mmetsp:Transcript_14263/g.38248  ORF Transcript_14263/g.38248 Transcript_14263/m.38248 type:complete len:83 (+) Transcript_14263:100-348(+)
MSGSEMVLQCEEGGAAAVRVVCASAPPPSTTPGVFVQVRGRVSSESALQLVSAYPLGSNFDLANYYAMVSLAEMPEYRHLFV